LLLQFRSFVRLIQKRIINKNGFCSYMIMVIIKMNTNDPEPEGDVIANASTNLD